MGKEEEPAAAAAGAEEGEEDSEESDDDDDVQITIGDITTGPGSYNRTPSYQRVTLGASGGEFHRASLKGAGQGDNVSTLNLLQYSCSECHWICQESRC